MTSDLEMKKIMNGPDYTEDGFKVDKRCFSCEVEVQYPEHFRNEISEREFRISGLCQNCQDEVFGED